VLKQLDELMSPTHNRRNYRRLEAEAVPPCVPYLGVSLGDLFFIESNEMGTCCALARKEHKRAHKHARSRWVCVRTALRLCLWRVRCADRRVRPPSSRLV
jgi:hypothetical protein